MRFNSSLAIKCGLQYVVFEWPAALVLNYSIGNIIVHISWTDFTPWTALFGGLLIGLAASLLLILNGRIAGISGILGGLFSNINGDKTWRLLFLAGLLVSPWLYRLIAAAPVFTFNQPLWVYGLSGVLVGLGTRLASGCTSGHGVCGLSALSLRSLVATLTFMAAGFIVVFIVRHGLGA